jgi:DNA repair protein RecN (Recombination protein N)
MLTHLAIRDVVLIEALDLEFGPGLGALTGETGAGKSILLDSLGLALGARADSGLVRHGVAQASVTASFDIPVDHPVHAVLAEEGFAGEPGEPLILKRIVKADGGSRATVNGMPAAAGLIRDIGAMLVEIHGQHDERGLLNPRGHRALLDNFARLDMGAVARHWNAWRETEAALQAARDVLDTAMRDREWLEHAVAELRKFAPEAGEEEILADRRALMMKSARLAEDLQKVRDLVEPGEAGLSKLRQAARLLERIAPEYGVLAEALAALDRAIIEGALAEDKLAEAAQSLLYSPTDLDDDESRLFELRALARKYRVAPDDLAAQAETLAGQLEAIETGEHRIHDLERQVTAERAAYLAAAQAASEARAAAALRLDAAMAGELPPLKLDAARFRTVVELLPESQWGAGGLDRVEFEISTNPGAPFAPLIKIASGGELSRFILALKVSLAEQGGATSMIFDEIDRGVGGAVASAIGDRLHRLSRQAQLLVVTHSPQVAARADRHLLIAKTSDGTVARTGVRQLSADERQEEIARMLSGAEVTDEARSQAARLLERLA